MNVRRCDPNDFDAILAIINDAAHAYQGIIPADRWHEPYMSRHYLQHEIEAGVRFYAYEDRGALNGVMGIQDVRDVTLLRHAYVRTAERGKGIGSRLMSEVRASMVLPSLVGTWAAAYWAISFYQKHGYRLVTREQKELLLRKYWSIPDRQIETSVVLADGLWMSITVPQKG